MTRKKTSSATVSDDVLAARKKFVSGDDAYDPGATLCGHAPRHQRAHYLGGGLWVCFECFAKLLLGSRYTTPSKETQS